MSVALLSDKCKLDAIRYGLNSSSPGFTVRLFSGNVTPTVGSDTSSFTEASYSGYSAISWNPGTPGINGVDKAAVTPFSGTFSGPSSDSATTVYGWYATYHSPDGSDHVLMSARFASAPVTLADHTQSITLNLAFDSFDYNSHG